MAVFETRSGAYFMYVSSGCAENRHLQAALAIFGAGSQAPRGIWYYGSELVNQSNLQKNAHWKR